MSITYASSATTWSMRFAWSAVAAGAPWASLTDNRFGVTGTALPIYGVRVPAFPKGDAVPGVRAWSPPV